MAPLACLQGRAQEGGDTPSTVRASRTRKRLREAEAIDDELNEVLISKGLGYIVPYPFEKEEPQTARTAVHEQQQNEDRYHEVDHNTLQRVVLFNYFVRPRLRVSLLDTEAYSYFRQALYAARDSWGGMQNVDVSRGDHNRGYGDPSNEVTIEPHGRNRSRGRRLVTDGTLDELTCVDEESDTVEDADIVRCRVRGEACCVLWSEVRTAVAAGAERAKHALHGQRGPEAECKGAWERAQQADASVVGEERCDDPTAAENGHRCCHCLSRHTRQLERFVETYRDAIGAGFDMVSLNLKSREMVHRRCGQLINTHMGGGRHRYLVSHTDRSDPCAATMRVTVLAPRHHAPTASSESTKRNTRTSMHTPHPPHPLDPPHEVQLGVGQATMGGDDTQSVLGQAGGKTALESQPYKGDVDGEEVGEVDCEVDCEADCEGAWEARLCKAEEEREERDFELALCGLPY